MVVGQRSRHFHGKKPWNRSNALRVPSSTPILGYWIRIAHLLRSSSAIRIQRGNGALEEGRFARVYASPSKWIRLKEQVKRTIGISAHRSRVTTVVTTDTCLERVALYLGQLLGVPTQGLRRSLGICHSEARECMPCTKQRGRRIHLHATTLLPTNVRTTVRPRRIDHAPKKQDVRSTTIGHGKRHQARRFTTLSQPGEEGRQQSSTRHTVPIDPGWPSD